MGLFNGSAQLGHIIFGVKILKYNAAYSKLYTTNFYLQGKQKRIVRTYLLMIIH